MPYTGISDKSLPPAVLALTPAEITKWLTAYNAAYKNAKNPGTPGGAMDDAKAHSIAMKMANNAMKQMMAAESGGFDGMTAFLKKLRSIFASKVDASEFDAAVRTARASSGGQGRSYKLRSTSEVDEENNGWEYDEEGEDFYPSAVAGLFLETGAFTENAPVWMPYLPIPGTYKHPKWGAVKLDAKRNAAFVKSYTDGVYGQQLPVDAEHETKLSGAVGWIQELRQNADDSVDARVEWTDRGNKLIEAGGYKYVSPEWYDEWVQPESGDVFTDVPIGAAITTRPFFKVDALRPLVASEDGTISDFEKDATMPETRMETPPPPHPGTPAPDADTGGGDTPPAKPGTTRTTTTVPKPAEREPVHATEEARNFAEYRERTDNELRSMREQVAAMEAGTRTRQFTDEVLGRSDANNIRWIGPVDGHVKTLLRFSEVFGGPDAQEVKDYIKQQRELSGTLRASQAFTEVGTGAEGSANTTALAEVTTLANGRVKAGTSKSFAEAVSEVMASDTALATRYYNETHG